jgi:hypothetical protein
MATATTSNSNNTDAGPNIDAWHFQDPRKTQSGGLSVYVDASTTNNSNPRIHLPPMVAPFGISSTDHLGNPLPPNRRRNMELDVHDSAISDLFTRVDDRVIAVAASKSMQWFSKDLHENELRRMMYRSCVQPSRNEQYNPKLRVKITPGTDKRATKIYVVQKDNTYRDDGTMDDVTRGSKVQAIIEVGSVWFAANQFGISLVAKHILVWPKDGAENAFPFTGVQLTQAKTMAPASGDDTKYDEDLVDDMISQNRYV